MMKPVSKAGCRKAASLLVILIALSLAAHAAAWPYTPVPSAPRGAQVMWVCKVEPLVPLPTTPRTWDMRYEPVSPLQGMVRPYSSPFGPAGLLPAVSQPQPFSYPVVRRCRLQAVVPRMPAVT